MWKSLFPDVSFNDKVCIEFIDGNSIVLKHLYFDDSALETIDWDKVTNCFEV
jgi:hypothetical protein